MCALMCLYLDTHTFFISNAFDIILGYITTTPCGAMYEINMILLEKAFTIHFSFFC